ncbi:hypothetical protein [Staphylococcus sp. GDH8C109P]|uniref:hypothetical protein n=1 Tax=Staphylococcus sp. GDH8C109P TaxID=2804088 RepID=UPI001AEBB0B7|nr:hypothetical protein [Staphylococcus sp. GDH8C109P]
MNSYYILIFLIWLIKEQINLFVLLYEKFSFPLLFLVIIIVFRKEISNLLKRVRQINVENNSGQISFLLSEMNDLKTDMENSTVSQIRQYGEDVREKGSLGGPPEEKYEQNPEFNESFNLIHLSEELHKELALNGPFDAIEKLYKAYTFLTEGKDTEDDNPTKIIKDVYLTAMSIKENGGYLLDDKLIYNYRSFIELSYKGLEKRNAKG